MNTVVTAFLDRDGVINRKLPGGRFVCCWDEFEFLPRAQEAIRLLNTNGTRVILVTNQRGVSLGLYSEDDLRLLHRQMVLALAKEGAKLDGIYYCPHADGTCSCRKPGIALFQKAFRDFPDATPGTSVIVGDSLSDMLAAQRLGCHKVLVGVDDSIRLRAEIAGVEIDFFAESLFAAVKSYIVPNSVKHSDFKL